MNKKRLSMALCAVAITGTMTGCVRPYQKPIFEEIGTSESAYLVPLVGDITEQNAFGSEELLESNKVATKRVEIPTEWVQLGRRHWIGEWKPTMKLIKVDRTAVTREWTESTGNGTSKENQGISTESKESIGFMARMSCTASIEEANASKFLYYYNTKTLSQIMDNEIRTAVESKFNEECGKRSLNQIQVEKSEIMESVRNSVVETFASKGITITSLGLKGEFEYFDKSIQESINKKFTAEKEQEAQAIANQTAIDKAKAEAEAIKTQASTIESQIRLKEAEAKVIESQAKLKQSEALAEWKNVQVIGDNPILMQNPLK